VVTLASGKTIQCDYYVPPCLGSGNCKFLPAASQDGNGYAKVRFHAHFHDSPHPAHVPPWSHPHIVLVPFHYWPRGRWRFCTFCSSRTQVDDKFRVTGFLNVFAIGDCSNISPVKVR